MNNEVEALAKGMVWLPVKNCTMKPILRQRPGDGAKKGLGNGGPPDNFLDHNSIGKQAHNNWAPNERNAPPGCSRKEIDEGGFKHAG